MNFFEPKGLNLSSIEGKGVSEFPILYYITACLYFVFGEQEFILRLINIIVVGFGLLYLYKLIRDLLGSIFYGYVFTFLFFSSTVFVYYTANFLPDVSALSFTIIGWYFFYLFFSYQSKKSLYKSFIFFTLSGLLKITFLMHPIAAFLLLLITKKKFKKLKTPFILFFSCVLINAIWIVFVLWYNTKNNNFYFNTKIRPIWSLSYSQIEYIIDHIINYWYTKYFFQSTFHLFFVILLLGVFYVRKISKEALIILGFLMLASILYIVLFFEMFQDHDYYFLTVFTTIIFLIVAFFLGIKKGLPRFIDNILVKLTILTICLLSINYSSKKLSDRYSDEKYSMKMEYCNNLEELTRMYQSEITRNKVILIGDESRNGGLYFLDTQGWVMHKIQDLTIENFNQMSDNGAKYLISSEQINDLNFGRFSYLGNYNDINIYKILQP